MIPLPEAPRILLTRTDRIGDLVLSTPVFEAVRKRYPQAWIAALVFLEHRELVEGNPHLNEVILYDKKGSEKGWPGNAAFAKKLARKKFDAVIHLHATNRMHWITSAAKIPMRIGWDRRSPKRLTHVFEDIKKEGKKHEAEYNFELLKPLDIACPAELKPYVPLHEKQHLSLQALLRRLKVPEGLWVVLSPSASCPSKRWPAERFAYVAEAMAGQNKDAFFLAIGSRPDRRFIEKMQRATSLPIYDLSGRLSLGMLAWLLKKASLLISNDSGPAHIATAVDTPVISIFGRNQPGLSPTRWRPLGAASQYVWKDVGCEVCLAHDCEINFLCLDAISSRDVLDPIQNSKIKIQS